MTVLEQLLKQIDHLSEEERAVLRQRLGVNLASTDAQHKNGNAGHTIASSPADSKLWGLLAQDADALDRMLESIYDVRQNRPLRVP